MREKLVPSVLKSKMKEEVWMIKRFIPYLSVYEFEALLFSDSNVYTSFSKENSI